MQLAHENAVRLSNRQYVLLRRVETADRSTLSIEEISTLHQGTLGSVRKRNPPLVVETTDQRGIKITGAGRLALAAYSHANISRLHPSLTFASALHLTVPKNLIAAFNNKSHPLVARHSPGKAA